MKGVFYKEADVDWFLRYIIVDKMENLFCTEL
jgi:hypothetical protein